MADQQDGIPRHDDAEYTARLIRSGESRWKRVVGVQKLYGGKARGAIRGRALEVGCGIGRLLRQLDGTAVGVDTNPHSVAVAVESGLTAMTEVEFETSEHASPASFDTLLFAHVLEHMTNTQASELVGKYLPYLAPDGRIVVIVPQEAGFASDPTHVEPLDLAEIEQLASDHRLQVAETSSFPLPRVFGRVFKYNETMAILQNSRQGIANG